MRNYLLLFIAIVLMASAGCSGSKSAANSPDTAADRASQNRKKNAATPGDKGATKDADSKKEDAKDAKKDDGKAVSKGRKTKKKEETKKSEGDSPRRSNARRRKIVPKPALGGGNKTSAELKEELMGKDDEEEDEAEVDDKKQTRSPRAPSRDTAKKEEEVESFLDRATEAFAAKHDTEAFQFAYAHMLADDEALEDYPIGWYQGLSAPRLGLRWGVAVNYSPGSFEGDPPVIGSGSTTSSTSGGGNNEFSGGSRADRAKKGKGGGMGATPPRKRTRSSASRRSGSSTNSRNDRSTASSRDGKPPAEELRYYAGDFGDAFVNRFEMRRTHSDAFYGKLLKDIDVDSAMSGDSSGSSSNTASTPPREREEEKNESQPGDGSNGGEFSFAGGGSNGARSNDRRPDRSGDRTTERSRRGGESSDAGYEADETSLAPGMMMLGVGNKNEMLANAKKQGVDLLAMFSVSVAQKGAKTNTILRVYNVATGEEVVSTKSLTNLAVDSARENENREDPVEVELDKVFRDTADIEFKSDSMPKAIADHASNRIKDLTEGKSYNNPLPILVEAKSYLLNGWISDNEYVSACEQLLGTSEAQDLIDGDMKAKERALKKWLPGNYKVESNNDGSDFR